MHATIFWPAFLASALALPASHLAPRQDSTSSFEPAPGSVAKCHVSDKSISFFVGPQKESVLNAACAEMMPACASGPSTPETVCILPMEWKLDGPKTSTQSANVLNADGNKISGWQVKFSATPPTNPTSPVMWTKAECYGYFDTLVSKTPPEGCMGSKGSGIGNYTVGGDSSLKGTVLDMQIVQRT